MQILGAVFVSLICQTELAVDEYLTGTESLGLQATALLQEGFFFGKDFLSFCEFSFQLFKPSPLFQNALHFLIQPTFLFFNLLLKGSHSIKDHKNRQNKKKMHRH